MPWIITRLTEKTAEIGGFLVEMAGVEPASERFDPRIYYECSLFIDLTSQRRNRQNLLRRSAQTRKPSFASRRSSAGSTLTLWRPLRDRPEIRCGWTWPEEVNCGSAAPLMQREALQRRKCDCWHLIFCTDFTRSAPLDSQSGTSLPRRDRNIPNWHRYYTLFLRNHLSELYYFR